MLSAKEEAVDWVTDIFCGGHTYATMLLMSGVNLHFVANQLGHSPIMTSTVYAKWISGEADRAELAKLDTSTEIFLQKEKAVESVADAELAPELAPAKTRGAKIIDFSTRKLVGTAGFEGAPSFESE